MRILLFLVLSLCPKIYNVMSRNKMKQFAENSVNPIFFQPYYQELLDGFFLKGKWNKEFFKNDHPIILELGCGKGEYTVGLAEKYPDKNFIGIDLKGARMWRGATDAQEKGLNNVAFIRNKVDKLLYFFDHQEVAEIWLTFSDPQPKRERRRLTSPRFLRLYQEALLKDGIVHVKTDSRELFDYTLDVINYFSLPLKYHTFDLYNSGYKGDAPQIQTYYEKIYLAEGKAINYAQFSLNEKLRNSDIYKLPKNDADGE